jgi:DNA protecting protein DprA
MGNLGTPLALWVHGGASLTQLTDTAVALTGTRWASGYGNTVAADFSYELARAGVTVVSGGSAGVDESAHRAALAGEGRTIVVLPCGVDQTYPREHARLYGDVIERGGLLVSEYPIGALAVQARLVARCRLLAALTSATVIVEAGQRSFALATARAANALVVVRQQGQPFVDVLALSPTVVLAPVPGQVDHLGHQDRHDVRVSAGELGVGGDRPVQRPRAGQGVVQVQPEGLVAPVEGGGEQVELAGEMVLDARAGDVRGRADVGQADRAVAPLGEQPDRRGQQRLAPRHRTPRPRLVRSRSWLPPRFWLALKLWLALGRSGLRGRSRLPGRGQVGGDQGVRGGPQQAFVPRAVEAAVVV